MKETIIFERSVLQCFYATLFLRPVKNLCPNFKTHGNAPTLFMTRSVLSIVSFSASSQNKKNVVITLQTFILYRGSSFY